jgi:hypothetical protein
MAIQQSRYRRRRQASARARPGKLLRHDVVLRTELAAAEPVWVIASIAAAAFEPDH